MSVYANDVLDDDVEIGLLESAWQPESGRNAFQLIFDPSAAVLLAAAGDRVKVLRLYDGVLAPIGSITGKFDAFLAAGWVEALVCMTASSVPLRSLRLESFAGEDDEDADGEDVGGGHGGADPQGARGGSGLGFRCPLSVAFVTANGRLHLGALTPCVDFSGPDASFFRFPDIPLPKGVDRKRSAVETSPLTRVEH